MARKCPAHAHHISGQNCTHAQKRLTARKLLRLIVFHLDNTMHTPCRCTLPVVCDGSACAHRNTVPQLIIAKPRRQPEIDHCDCYTSKHTESGLTSTAISIRPVLSRYGNWDTPHDGPPHNNIRSALSLHLRVVVSMDDCYN